VPCDLARHSAEERNPSTHHVPQSEEHQVSMHLFCGSYDFLCRAAFDQQGWTRRPRCITTSLSCCRNTSTAHGLDQAQGFVGLNNKDTVGKAASRDLTLLPA
jgi:hypothetical protein